MTEERRDFTARAAIVQRVIEGVVQNPSVMLTVEMLQQWLNVPHDAARRILGRLDSSGLITEVQRDGTCWCGGTRWHGRDAMRISVSSWATTPADAERSAQAIIEAASRCRP